MGSQILRPNKEEWLVQGSWGRRNYEPMSKVDFYELLHGELIQSGILAADSPMPSNKHHDHVTMEVMRSSWIDNRWVRDEPLAARLKNLRERAHLTQDQLAEKSALDVGTIRQLEQGTRTNPQWQTICALARGLEKDVVVFVGTEGWQPPVTDELRRRRDEAERGFIIEKKIVMRLESLGHAFNREIDKPRRVELRSMTKPELEQLAVELKNAPTWQEAIRMIVSAICESKAARRAEEDKKYDAIGAKARVSMTL
ncbi:MAG: transcriptional regulator [Gemmataceae bacterium]|nr:transcriptional regulator [Gemmataceae bacterium]MCI0739441.1 transcriptional regulator [Gemmataceae bacterium]